MKIYLPTDPSATTELRNPSNDDPELRKFRRSPDVEALKLLKGPVGLLVRQLSYDSNKDRYSKYALPFVLCGASFEILDSK